MGAAYAEMRVDPSKTKDEVRKIFEGAQDQDRYENGHSYSGGFGMARGLIFDPKRFTADESPYDYVVETAQKWGPAVCVRVEGPAPHWYIGAWCSS